MEDKTQLLWEAQTTFLNRVAPGYKTKRISWSKGTTQVIEYGSGEPLLLIHGGLGEALQWGPILPRLGKHYKVLAVDRPGHGLADPFDYTHTDLLAHASQFIGDIIEGEKLASVHICGSSMGGLWATTFALRYPKRVSSLLLVGAPAGITRQQPLQMRLGSLPGLKNLIRKMMLKPTTKSTYSFWTQMLVANGGQLSDELLIALTASQARNAPSWFTLLDNTVNFWGLKDEIVLGDEWNRLSVPTTFIWGDKDVWAPPSLGKKIVDTNRNCKLVVIPNAGHAPWIDQPEAVADAMLSALMVNKCP